MFNLGFSYVGLIYLVMLFAPNIIGAKNKPKDYTSEGENKVLSIFEKIGQGLCAVLVLVFREFNIRSNAWAIVLALSALSMVIYELAWVRYFKSNRTAKDMYRSFLGIKFPLSTLPVAAFFLLGIYGTNIFLIIATIILGIGHIGIHKKHARELGLVKKSKLSIRILKGIGVTLLTIILAIPTVVIAARNLNYFLHYKLIVNGVDECLYTEIGGQEQFLLVRGNDVDNPVIIYLHGGPSSPDTYFTNFFANDLLEKYTVIAWDQRGCGRTYFRNADIDSTNETASFEQAIEDVDDLVDYACERFGQEKVIIMGHSYGTVLGPAYIEQHPEKVSAYVGIAQVVSMADSNAIMYNDSMDTALAEGENTNSMETAWTRFNSNPTVMNTIAIRNACLPFIDQGLPDNSVLYAMTSPYMSMDDYRWFMYQLGGIENFINLNEQLYDVLMDFDLRDLNLDPSIPVYFISGTKDFICPIEPISEYADSHANCSVIYIEDCGHSVQYTKPHEVSEAILEALG
jgi:pimeloyl-ACP methyl ester carboxylesterase